METFKQVCDLRPKVNHRFDSVLSSHLGKAQRTVTMEQDLENYDFGLEDANGKILKTTTDNFKSKNATNVTMHPLKQEI